MLKTPTEILEFMDDIEYGYFDYINNVCRDVDDDFSNNYKLQSPDEVIGHKVGVCWDQVELERYLFQKSNIEFSTYFIVHYDNDKCPTHTFLIYKENDKFFWFEHSWNKYRGINSYDTRIDALKDIRDKFMLDELYDDYNNVFIYEYSKPQYGIDVSKFYKHCENGNNIVLD